MPLQTSIPQSIVEPAIQLGAANHYQVMGFTFLEPYHGSPALAINCAVGLADAQDATVITWVKMWVVRVEGAALAALASQLTTGQPFYQEIKAALYAYLQASGEFPGGTLS